MQKRRQEIIGILMMVIALFMAISMITYSPTESPSGLSSEIAKTNFMGLFGIYVSWFLIKLIFGLGSVVFPIVIAYNGFILFTRRDFEKSIYVSIYILSIGIWISLLIAFIGTNLDSWWTAEFSGLVGFSIFTFVIDFIGSFAFGLLLAVLLLFLLSGILKFSIYEKLIHIKELTNEKWVQWKENRQLKSVVINKSEESSKPEPVLQEEQIDENNSIEEGDKSPSQHNLVDDTKENTEQVDDTVNKDENLDENNSDEEVSKDISIEDETSIVESDLDSQKDRRAKYRQYKLPITDYLFDPIEIENPHSEDELREKASQLVHALQTFGVDGRVVKISPGPVITLFEIEPAEGVRVNKFTNLSDDLARVMKAQRIRVIAPIPGSRSVGIELPNDRPSIVYLKNIINSERYVNSDTKLTVGLGKTTTGDAYTFDLNQMPHLLVAGATGAGKSVCINTIIISILYKAKPDEVKFILVDPKKLELATYKSLVGYHLITAPNLDEYVMTTAENAVGILDSAIAEMERRFQVFSDARVRNITEYHERCKQDSELENVPYVVVLIDELADLMMTSGRAIEEPITRLAQKARAVGIHLVVATQRPSVDVITGLIKSNFPARIAFQVSSKIDSRTIIDQMGAEKLLGRGDMLFLLPGTASPIRLHNAYITLEEIEAVMNHITTQPKPDEIMLPKTKEEKGESDFTVDGDRDELLKDAAELVINHQQASVSLLQRKFRIGYSRAGRLIDELESLGIVSGYSGSKARDVLVELSYLENVFND